MRMFARSNLTLRVRRDWALAYAGKKYQLKGLVETEKGEAKGIRRLKGLQL